MQDRQSLEKHESVGQKRQREFVHVPPVFRLLLQTADKMLTLTHGITPVRELLQGVFRFELQKIAKKKKAIPRSPAARVLPQCLRVPASVKRPSTQGPWVWTEVTWTFYRWTRERATWES